MATDADRRCYLHVGMHKTGTTSLQDTLTRNADVFGQSGLHIATTGRPIALAKSYYVANQNLAWQMVADKRFDPSLGTLEDLERELAGSRLRHAVVTSEDFILAYDRPERLNDLRDVCLRAGYRPTIVVYLREQLTYAKSLYAMFVVNGKLPISFEDFCAFVVADNVVWGQHRFPFEYETFLEPLIRCFGDEYVIVRRYPEGKPSHHLLHDFVSLLAPARPIAMSRLAVGPPLNEAGSYLQVMQSLHGNCSAADKKLESPFSIATRCGIPMQLLIDPYNGIDAQTVERFRERFERANALLRVRFGIVFDNYRANDSSEHRLQITFLRECARAWSRPTEDEGSVQRGSAA